MSRIVRMLRRVVAGVALASVLMPTHAQTATSPPAARRVTTDVDRQAILAVTVEFREALAARDARRLSALLLNSRILFTSPASPARVRQVQAERDVNADGVPTGGASEFLSFVASSKVPIEERFHDIRITQDGHLAWVMFDFEFLEDGRVENHGLEVWQMLKTADERWKIFSVVWSSHGALK